MPNRSSRNGGSGRVTPKGTTPPATASRSSSPPHQRAVDARRQAEKSFHGPQHSAPPPAAFRRSGHR